MIGVVLFLLVWLGVPTVAMALTWRHVRMVEMALRK